MKPKKTVRVPSQRQLRINNEQIEIEESGYPDVGEGLSICILLINIFLPGLGTQIMACCTSGNCCRNSSGSCSASCCGWWYIGGFQSLLSYFIIGWIWGIYTGVQCIRYNRKK